MFMEINGNNYELATTLRVAYSLQGKHNHKPYSKIFSEISDMPIEKQVEVLYTAFEIKNPEEAKELKFSGFLNYCLDNFNLGEIMSYMEGVIEGIMGKELMEKAVEESKKGAEGN